MIPAAPDRPRAASQQPGARALDAIPGALAWSALGGVLITAWIAPRVLLIGVALLAAYCAARFAAAAIAFGRGLQLIRQWENTDWIAAGAPETPAAGSLHPADVRHLVLLPSFQEPDTVLRRSLNALAAHSDAPLMTVVLAMEAAELGSTAQAQRLQSDFSKHFASVIIAVHPADLPGERRCKSANLRWALTEAQEILAGQPGWHPDRVIVSVMDADTLWHPQHFACLRVQFAADRDRHSAIWQAPIRYHANLGRTHSFLHILHAYASAWELAYLAAPWWQALPMSSYALSLRLLQDSGSWDGDAIADEWRLAIKAFFVRGARLRVVPIYLPFLAQATGRGSLANALKERYRQTFRHAWGAKEIGTVLRQIPAHPQIALRRRLGLLLRVAHDNLLAGAGWIVLTLGSQLPLLLHPAAAADLIRSPAFLTIQGAFALLAGLTIGVWVADLRQRPADTETIRRHDHLLELLGLPLTALLTALVVALPVLHAQTWLLLGRAIVFHVTPKS